MGIHRDAKKEAIATEIAAGIAPAQIARAHGYASSASLNALLKTEEMTALVTEKKELLQIKAQQLVAKAWLAADTALGNIVAISQDPIHKRHYDASVYLVERVWPSRTINETEIKHTIDATVAATIVDGISEMRKVNTGDEGSIDDHLHEGQEIATFKLDSGYGTTGGNGKAKITPTEPTDE
jgi:hypothetical protein